MIWSTWGAWPYTWICFFRFRVYGSLYMLVTKGWRHCGMFDAVMLFVCIYCNDLLLKYLFFCWRIMTLTDISSVLCLVRIIPGHPKETRILGIITRFTLSWRRLLHSNLPQVLTSIPSSTGKTIVLHCWAVNGKRFGLRFPCWATRTRGTSLWTLAARWCSWQGTWTGSKSLL